MKTSKLEILDDLHNVTFKLFTQEPFFSHFFTGLIKKVSDEIDTLAVGYHNGLVILYINPEFWTERLNTIDYKIGGIKHEILHIVLKHIFRYKQFNHKTIFNIAADLVVNQYVAPDQLIKGAVLLENFPELNLETHEHINYYYNELLNLYQKFSSGDNKEDGENNQAWQNLKRLLDQANENQQRHNFWKNIDELSSAERDIIESAINQGLENTLQRIKSEDFGKLPAGLQQYLKEFELSMTPNVNWKRILNIFTNSSSRTRVRNTLKRPSKRYGTNPGIKVHKKQKILVAIDTSGSIDMGELQDFFNELYHIWRQGADIMVVECDTKIHRKYAYSGKTPETVSGGGGTSFDAPLIFANEEYRPDALIYFTDGYASRPSVKLNCPILWLVSQQGADLNYMRDFPGRKVKMN